MGLTLNKRELTMVVILVSVLYIFIAAKFVVIPAIPQFEEINNDLKSLKIQKEALDSDLKNIEAKRNDLATKKVNDQRIEEYLMSNAGIPESIEFIEKLAFMVGKQLENVSISKPVEKTAAPTTVPSATPAPAADNQTTQTENAEGETPVVPVAASAPTKYYEFSVNFKTVMTYDETAELVKYCEGGSKKVKVSLMDMSPAKNDGQPEMKFDVRMRLNFYSLNLGAADKLSEYSRLKFHNYIDGNSLPLMNTQEDAAGNVMIPEIANSEAVKQTQQDGSFNAAYSDINIKEVGFLVGGENFELYSNDDKNKKIRIKTKERVTVKINLNSSGYTIDAVEDSGTSQMLSCTIPDRDTVVIYADVGFPAARENEKLGVDLIVTNDSGKKVVVKFIEGGSKVKLMDRTGAVIFNKSDKENLSVM